MHLLKMADMALFHLHIMHVHINQMYPRSGRMWHYYRLFVDCIILIH
jgi:hypothetical protein